MPEFDNSYAAKIAWKDSFGVAQNEVGQALLKSPEMLPTKVTFVTASFEVNYYARHLTNWVFYILADDTMTAKQFVAGDPFYEAVRKWGHAVGDGLGKFVAGDRVMLPVFPSNLSAKTAASTPVEN
jgi:hypothetical protein